MGIEYIDIESLNFKKDNVVDSIDDFKARSIASANLDEMRKKRDAGTITEDKYREFSLGIKNLIENNNADFKSLEYNIYKIKKQILSESRSEIDKVIDDHRKTKKMNGTDMQTLYINALNEAKITGVRSIVDGQYGYFYVNPDGSTTLGGSTMMPTEETIQKPKKKPKPKSGAAKPAEAPKSGATKPAEAPKSGAAKPAEAPKSGTAKPAEAPKSGTAKPAEAPKSGAAKPAEAPKSGAAKPAEAPKSGTPVPNQGGAVDILNGSPSTATPPKPAEAPKAGTATTPKPPTATPPNPAKDTKGSPDVPNNGAVIL